MLTRAHMLTLRGSDRFDQLYEDAKKKAETTKKVLEDARTARPEGCTFAPQFATRSATKKAAAASKNKDSREDRFSLLYQEGKKQLQDQATRIDEKKKRRGTGCTFHPQVNNTPHGKEGGDPARFGKLYDDGANLRLRTQTAWEAELAANKEKTELQRLILRGPQDLLERPPGGTTVLRKAAI